MPLTSLTIRPTLSNPSSLILVNDLTDYDAQGYPSDTYVIRGYLQVELTNSSGSRTVYNNLTGPNPDILPYTATNNLYDIPLPQDVNGNPEMGIYTVTLRSEVVLLDLVTVDTELTQTFIYTLDMDIPVPCLAEDVNCEDSKITSYDKTDYGSYVSSKTIVHTLFPPPASGQSNIVGSTAVITTTADIYTKTWTQKINNTVTYAFPDGLYVVLTVLGSREFEVACGTGISDIWCCVNKMKKRYDAAITRNPVLASNLYEQEVKPTMEAAEMYILASWSGKVAGQNYWYNKIKEYSGCGEECGCGDDSPQQVIPVGSSASFVVDSPDNSISVTPDPVGNQVTFHIQVSATLQNIINNLYARTITTATPSYIQLTETGTGANRNTRIDFIPGAIGATTPFIEARFELSAAGGANLVDGTINIINQAGTVFAPGASQNIAVGENSPNVGTDIAVLKYTGFLAGTVVDYNVNCKVMGLGSTTSVNALKTIEAEVYYFDSTDATGKIWLRLYRPSTGVACSLAEIAALAAETPFYVTLNLSAKSA